MDGAIDALTGPDREPEVHVEPWPAGGWVVRLPGHPVPVSRHDTEEEATQRAAAYRRGLARLRAREVTGWEGS